MVRTARRRRRAADVMEIAGRRSAGPLGFILGPSIAPLLGDAPLADRARHGGGATPAAAGGCA